MSDFFEFNNCIFNRRNVVMVLRNDNSHLIKIEAGSNAWTFTYDDDSSLASAWEDLQLKLLGPPEPKAMLKLAEGRPGEDDKDSVCEVTLGPHPYGYNPFLDAYFCQECGKCNCCADDNYHLLTPREFVESDED